MYCFYVVSSTISYSYVLGQRTFYNIFKLNHYYQITTPGITSATTVSELDQRRRRRVGIWQR